MADITIYYMDIRTFGKGYEQFYQNAQAMGVEFVRGKVASISEDEEQNPVVKVELTENGEIVEKTHDLVVLSLGMIPSISNNGAFGLSRDDKDRFFAVPEPNAHPNATTCEGIYVTGTAMGPMDIVDSIISASAAASAASAYLREHQKVAVYD